MKRNYILINLIGLLALASCETVTFPELEESSPVLVVDAWINNKPEPQTVTLTKTQSYFTSELPPVVVGATVTIEDSNGKIYVFTETEPGKYTWTPVGDEVFGEPGLGYTLSVQVDGETFNASTIMGSVPVVDSITFTKEEGNQFVTDLYLAEFWSVDRLEIGNTYWIKTFKNSALLNKPEEINLAYDAGIAKGGNINGFNFIAPIRNRVNPFDEDSNGDIVSPYVVGDSLFVEIHSLSEASFNFMTQVVIQTNRPGGFSELFSTPLANVSTNINNVDPNGSKVVGFFNVASVSGLGRKFASLDDVTDN